MMQTTAMVVWTALTIIGYVYIGYPLILWILAKLRYRKVLQADITPSVTLLISAFNEAHSIGKKLQNSVTLDYPAECIEVMVVSDASTDATDSIVGTFAGQGVSLLRQSERCGKTVGLNAAVNMSHSDIIVFSDANILYQKSAIRHMVQNFADPTVGCVTGDSRYVSMEQSAAHLQESTYWRYEQLLRTAESQIGSTVGADGAIFAIRRELYIPLSSEAINDLVTPLQIVSRGYRAVFEPAAVGFESPAGTLSGEFRRKRRIVNRSWRGVMSVPAVLDPRQNSLFAWQVWSHKILRWFVLPLALVAGIGCFIAYPLGWIYQLGAWGFVSSLAVASIGTIVSTRLGWLARLAHGILYFYLVNFAAILGIALAIAGRIEVLWTPERRENL